MRTIWRTADTALLRDIGALAAAVGFVGLSFGAIATAAHLPLWATIAMSLLIFAGGSQFLAVGLVAGGNPGAAILAGRLAVPGGGAGAARQPGRRDLRRAAAQRPAPAVRHGRRGHRRARPGQA